MIYHIFDHIFVSSKILRICNSRIFSRPIWREKQTNNALSSHSQSALLNCICIQNRGKTYSVAMSKAYLDRSVSLCDFSMRKNLSASNSSHEPLLFLQLFLPHQNLW